ncbi:hypothetical protein HPP92_011920 [Vanilla planifolia]|uniref:cAMP-regulated phosphoprotein 19-related protein n=1 Tax=Vanilla planifolia TaxID=51239 RepID=A0A835V5H4_VANPL|nr:hypothetical protein HPP92_011920 [Vanilla planifolia]
MVESIRNVASFMKVTCSFVRMEANLASMMIKKMSDIKDADIVDNIEKSEEVAGGTEAVLDEGNSMPSSQEEEASIKKKYGGIVPKKPPLISKDHERAFFDSADWALGKQGGKPKGPLEALRPKLQPTQQQARSRRSAYASTDSEDGGYSGSEDANSQ